MNPQFAVFSALILDLALGDPSWLPHPVRWIGKAARFLERKTRRIFLSPFLAGSATSVCIYLLSFFLPWAIIAGARHVSYLLEFIFSIFIIYTAVALRDLLDHSRAVRLALEEKNLEKARERVGRIVGRDTQNLSESEIVRACVESVAESLVDGITAPLFYAIFGGPAWAMLYRSVNTLDSLFGYRNEKYARFGTLPARTDDLANFLPARLTAPLVSVSAMLLRLHPVLSLQALYRDGKKHPSPNSGLCEAAMAGALGIRLGGTNYYQGIASEKPFLGYDTEALSPIHILSANRIALLTSAISLALFISIRIALYSFL